MAMNLRLTDEQTEELRRRAQQDQTSMQEVVHRAIDAYLSNRPRRLKEAIGRVRTEDAELLARLAR